MLLNCEHGSEVNSNPTHHSSGEIKTDAIPYSVTRPRSMCMWGVDANIQIHNLCSPPYAMLLKSQTAPLERSIFYHLDHNQRIINFFLHKMVLKNMLTSSKCQNKTLRYDGAHKWNSMPKCF